jgi:hypothetical protein
MQARDFPDRNTENNKLKNLHWGRADILDKITHGTLARGARNGNAKLKPRQVRKVKARKHWPYGTVAKLAKRYNVTTATIKAVTPQKL